MLQLFLWGSVHSQPTTCACVINVDKMSQKKKYDQSNKHSQTQGPSRTKIDNYPEMFSGQRFTAATQHYYTRCGEFNIIGDFTVPEPDTIWESGHEKLQVT